MKIDTKLLDMTFKIAQSNPVQYLPRLAAMIVRRGKVISVGINERKTDPFQLQFAKNQHATFKHAEISAIKTAWQEAFPNTLRGCLLYVARAKYLDISKQKFVWGNARPCCGCMKAISMMNKKNKLEISGVIYTTDVTGEIGVIEF